MTNTLPNLESRLAALESDLAEHKQVNAELHQRAAELEAASSCTGMLKRRCDMVGDLKHAERVAERLGRTYENAAQRTFQLFSIADILSQSRIIEQLDELDLKTGSPAGRENSKPTVDRDANTARVGDHAVHELYLKLLESPQLTRHRTPVCFHGVLPVCRKTGLVSFSLQGLDGQNFRFVMTGNDFDVIASTIMESREMQQGETGHLTGVQSLKSSDKPLSDGSTHVDGQSVEPPTNSSRAT